VRAWLAVRDGDHYRRDAFAAGLRAAGCGVRFGLPRDAGDADVLVLWNRYPPGHEMATAIERRGGTVLVAENGYLGRRWRGEHWFALARSHHNGAGDWMPGGPERWDALGETPSPWREGGAEILVLPQRGIGAPGVAMPRSWPADIVAWLRRRTDRPVRVRPHPGRHEAAVPLEQDLERAWCAVTWGSGAAVKALVHGVPVLHAMPRWIGAPAALPVGPELERRWLGDRLPMLRRMAWAMWRIEEIANGEAFRHLLPAAR
jgi:hypothetical protein